MINKSRLILSILLIFSILATASAQTKLTTGTWRGILKTSTGHELPFNFEVSDVAGHQQIAIINGSEHYKVPDVKTVGDSVFIKMPLFDSEFRLKLEGENLTGNW